MNCLIVINHGSGCEMMSVSLVRELVKSNKYRHVSAKITFSAILYKPRINRDGAPL